MTYEPFGEEWEKEIMRHTKAEIIDLLKESCKQLIAIKEAFKIDCLKIGGGEK